ncbi:MAG: ligase-associated DNA damage response endonuclease PdeM [Gemmatimonadales bacterium]
MTDVPGACAVELGDTPLLLLPGRVAFREGDRTLFVADLHVGKAATFRSHGVSVPPGTTGETLDRLADLVAATGSRRVVILGDLLHAAEGRHPRTEARLAAWRAVHVDLRVDLIRGNHDHTAGDPDVTLGIDVHDAPHLDGDLTLFHQPPSAHAHPWLAGHVHPAVRLAGAGRQRLTIPCFHLTAGGMVLPAFGAFTGLATVRIAPGDRVFAIAGEAVVEAAVGLRTSAEDPESGR